MKINGIDIGIAGAIAEEIAEEERLLREQVQEALSDDDLADNEDRDEPDGDF
jgi:hypothetical protein